jgi:hypothetical protein
MLAIDRATQATSIDLACSKALEPHCVGVNTTNDAVFKRLAAKYKPIHGSMELQMFPTKRQAKEVPEPPNDPNERRRKIHQGILNAKARTTPSEHQK